MILLSRMSDWVIVCLACKIVQSVAEGENPGLIIVKHERVTGHKVWEGESAGPLFQSSREHSLEVARKERVSLQPGELQV